MRKEDQKIVETNKAPELELEEEDLEYNDEGLLVPKKYVGLLARNPNGANKSVPDPRQELCWKLYLQGLAKGEANGKAAALAAGYSFTTACNITNIKWFADKKAKLKRKNFLTKAERNLGKLLDMEWTSMRLVNGEPTQELDIDKVKLVKDVSVFLAETLGKDEGYSKKIQEEKNVSHDIKIESVNYAEAIEIPQVQEVVKETLIDEIKNE